MGDSKYRRPTERAHEGNQSLAATGATLLRRTEAATIVGLPRSTFAKLWLDQAAETALVTSIASAPVIQIGAIHFQVVAPTTQTTPHH